MKRRIQKIASLRVLDALDLEKMWPGLADFLFFNISIRWYCTWMIQQQCPPINTETVLSGVQAVLES